MRCRGLVVLVFVGLLVAGASAAAELRLASTDWPPFTDEPGASRFAIDLVKVGLGRAGHRGRTTLVEDGRLIASIESGEFQGSAALWRDAEREALLLYSEPYLENRLMLVGRKGSDVSAGEIAALGGKRIATVVGYSYGAEVDSASGPILVEGPTLEANLQRLLAAEVDYMLVDELVLQHIVEAYAEQSAEKLAIGDAPLVRRTLHFALRRDVPDAEVIVAGFNEQIRGMLADRTYNSILRLNWIEADVDGDGTVELVLHGEHAGERPPGSGYSALPGEEAGQKFRFVVGGKVYDDWNSVPDRYKTSDPAQHDPDRSTAKLMKIKW